MAAHGGAAREHFAPSDVHRTLKGSRERIAGPVASRGSAWLIRASRIVPAGITTGCGAGVGAGAAGGGVAVAVGVESLLAASAAGAVALRESGCLHPARQTSSRSHVIRCRITTQRCPAEQNVSAAGGSEAAIAAARFAQLAFLPFDRLIAGDDELRDAIAFFDYVIRAPEIEHHHANL